jgi:hypothetical protein
MSLQPFSRKRYQRGGEKLDEALREKGTFFLGWVDWFVARGVRRLELCTTSFYYIYYYITLLIAGLGSDYSIAEWKCERLWVV